MTPTTSPGAEEKPSGVRKGSPAEPSAVEEFTAAAVSADLLISEELLDEMRGVREELRSVNAGMSAVLGLEGLRNVLEHAFADTVGALRPVQHLQPRSYELPEAQARALARLRNALARPDFNGVGVVPSGDTFSVPFLFTEPDDPTCAHPQERLP